MKIRSAAGWIALGLATGLLGYSILAPRSLPGIVLRRTAEALLSLFQAPDESGEGEGPVEVVPGQVVPGEVIPWE